MAQDRRFARVAGVLVTAAALMFEAVWGCRKAEHSETAETPAAAEDEGGTAPGAEDAAGPAGEHLRRGWELFDNEDYEGAIAAYTKAIELDPDGKIGQDARNSLGVMGVE